MMMCQMAGCLKICKNCKNKKGCDIKGVCMSIYETNKGLKCSNYKTNKEKKQ